MVCYTSYPCAQIHSDTLFGQIEVCHIETFLRLANIMLHTDQQRAELKHSSAKSRSRRQSKNATSCSAAPWWSGLSAASCLFGPVCDPCEGGRRLSPSFHWRWSWKQTCHIAGCRERGLVCLQQPFWTSL